MAVQLFKVPAASITVPSVTLQAAAHGSLTFTANYFFMGIGDNVSLYQQLDILDGIEWLMTLATAWLDTPRFPRPVAAGCSFLTAHLIADTRDPKQESQVTLVHQATTSDPLSNLDSISFGLTGAVAPTLGPRALESAFEVMKAFSLQAPAIWP